MSGQTIRQHAEAIRESLTASGQRSSPLILHARAIIDALDNAEKVRLSIEGQGHLPCRAVYDPEASP